MEVLAIFDKWPTRQAGGHRMGKSAWLGLCAAALLAGTGSVTAVAQTSGDVPRPEWSTVQFRGSAVGDPQRGQRVVEAKCATCHGTDGNSSDDPQFPKLAGQNSAYLYWQLWAFKRGTRRSEVMSGIVGTLSDADMANAASFFSRQTRKPDSVKDRRLAAIGERIFFAGAPPCAMCHGSAGQRGMPMMGMMGRGMMGMRGFGNAPRLNGQHAAYVIDQLNRFVAGERPGVMNRIAASLSERDMMAVAEYLSGLR